MKRISTRLLLITMMTALVLSCIGISEKTFAASKKAKTTYSVSVSNINSNTVLKKGAKIKIAYKATKKKNGVAKGAKVKFKSSNKKVASVSKKGVIKAKKKGTAYITVYCKAKPSKKKKIKIRVGTPVSTISVSGYRYLYKGRSTTFTRSTNSGATNKNVTWKSDNTAVATVNSAGRVTAKGYGTATIYATAKDGSRVSGSRTVIVHKYTKDDANWIAHRGLHASYKENTADAFRAAGKADFWGCECDIWETKHTYVEKENLPEISGEEDADTTKGNSETAAVINAILELELDSDEHDYTWVIDNSDTIKAVKDDYDKLDNIQKYEVRTALIDSVAGKEGLQTFLDAVYTIDTFNSFEIVVNHDATFKSVWNNSSSVKSMTAEQIKSKLPKVCFFDEYLTICNDWDMVPIVEFKDSVMSDEAVKKTIYMIEKSGRLGDAYLICFYDAVLWNAKKATDDRLGVSDASITYYLATDGEEWKVDRASERHYTGISVRKSLFSGELYRKARGYGLGIGTWTYKGSAADDNYMYNQVINYDIDFATVDYKVY